MAMPLASAIASFLALLAGVPGQEGQAPGPREKLTSTPGLRLTYAPWPGDGAKAPETARYALKTEGFPKDQRYALYARWIDGRSTEIVRGLHLGESGMVQEPDGHEYALALGDMFPGEFAAFALVSEDGASKAFVEITPFPIQAEGKGGCRLLVRPMDPKGQVFSITGSGFKPNERLNIVSTSSGEIGHSTSDGRPDGTLKHVVFPAVVGWKGGESTFQASDSDCSVKVVYKWGDAMRRQPTAPVRPNQ